MSSNKSTTSDGSTDINFGAKFFQLKTFDIWALGITIALGGQYFGWNLGLSAGFGSFAICTLLMCSAYTCLILCVSEITSALPFAGGAYGLARISLGFYPGFAIGCSEVIEYTLYTSAAVLELAHLLCDIFLIDAKYKPLLWLAFYMTAIPIHIYGKRVFWTTVHILAIFPLLVLVMYFLGSMKHVNFEEHAKYVADSTRSNPSYFIGGVSGFMTAFYNTAWWYVGVESLAFAANLTKEPKKIIPTGSILSMITITVTSILVMFVCVSLPQGDAVIDTTDHPLAVGMAIILSIKENSASCFVLPAVYATAFGFIFPYGKLMESMAHSKLLPDMFRWKTKTSGTPYVAILFGSLLGYLACIVSYFLPAFETKLFEICILSAFVTYITQCIGYISLSTKYQSITREFHSPLGIYGAVYAILVFSLGIISVVAFQSEHQYAIVSIIMIQIVVAIYYFTYAKHHQTFSEEESKIMFVAHVITFNSGANKRNKRKHKGGSSNIHQSHSHVSNSSFTKESRFSMMGLSKMGLSKMGLPYAGRKIQPISHNGHNQENSAASSHSNYSQIDQSEVFSQIPPSGPVKCGSVMNLNQFILDDQAITKVNENTTM